MSLSSLIVQREIASIREVEEALARQVLYGGDLLTNLLEVSNVEESAVLPVVADSFSLPPAPAGELPRVPETAMKLVAGEVAFERSFLPLEVNASLVIAVAEPLHHDVEQELSFALALPIEQRIAPLFRIRQALARDYGQPMDKRTARLITKVVHKGPRMASTFPPPIESQPAFRAAPRPPSLIPPPLVSAAPKTKAAPEGTFVRPVEPPPPRPAKRRRGPLTLDIALSELEASLERDVIFDVMFEFARQFFDYTALFIVHGDLAEGRDAFGDGASRDKVARIGVPLDLANLLQRTRDQKSVLRGKPDREGLDRVLMADLGREGTTECVVIPIIVRTRVVALVLADGGKEGIDATSLGPIGEIVEAAAAAFERLIVRRKLKQQEPREAGALAAKQKAADTIPPPPTQVSSPPVYDEGDVSIDRTQGARHEATRKGLGIPTSDSSERPAVEELAPPIRELMNDPVSRTESTRREPTAQLFVDPVSIRSDRPPPANLLAVRRPTGRPIPREEPDSIIAPLGARPARTPPPSPRAKTPFPTRSRTPLPNARTKSGSHKRAEAPALEFGTPSMPSVVTENAFGADAAERQLLAQIQGEAPGDDAPKTSPAGSSAFRDREPSSQGVHPWGGDVSSSAEPFTVAPHSPKAESPPPMPVAAPITDLSPQPILPLSSAPITPITEAKDAPAEQPSEGPSPTPTPGLSRTLVAGEAPNLDAVVNPPVNPVSPLIIVTPDKEMKPVGLLPMSTGEPREREDPDATPIAPIVSTADREEDDTSTPLKDEPVLSLAQRKGMPPVLPSQPEPKPMPPSEQQVSVPAHKPPSSRSDHSRVLPSVIVDVSSEYVTLVDRVLNGPDEEAETDLLRAGGYAMAAIMAKFPGPIVIEAERLSGAVLPRVAECGPVIRLVASQRRTALPSVLTYIESPDAELRFWATYLLTELVYPDAVDAAVGRVFDEAAKVRRVARAAVRALAEVHPTPIIDRLAEVANDTRELWSRRAQAIEALGETREPSVIPVLLPLLDDKASDVAVGARQALITITRQDFGLDADRWTSWWAGNKARHRLEWLIDALMHEHRAQRAAASEELRIITKEYFGYYDDLPKRERERAQARYREWWETIGRYRFSRASSRGA